MDDDHAGHQRSSASDANPDLEKEPTRRSEVPEALTQIETSQSSISPPKSLWKEAIFITVLCLAQFMTQACLAISILPVHIIGHSFGTDDAGELSWFAAAFSLTAGTFILVAGRLGDVYGHRLIFVLGFAWFALWSLLAGFSVWSNQIFFDFCRAFQGIGSSLVLPNGVAILGRTYPPGMRKQMAFSLFGASAPSGFVVGGVFSSIFAQLVWWPWGYWVMGIVCAVLAVLGLLVIPYTPRPVFNDNLRFWTRLDFLGASTGIAGMVLINFAWNQAVLVGWTMPYTYALLIVGFICLALFGYIERNAVCPLLPKSAFVGELAWVLGCIAAGWSSFGILIYYFYQFMEVIKGDTPLLAMAKFSAAPISGAIAALTTGFLLGRIPASFIMFCSMVAFTAGLAIFATVPVDQIYWAQTFVTTIVICWGMDMSFPSGTLILSNAMPKQHQGLAASLVTTAVNYSISMGLGLAGTVDTHVNEGGKNVLRGYRGALYMGVGLAGLGLVISLGFMFVSWVRYRKQQKSEAELEKSPG